MITTAVISAPAIAVRSDPGCPKSRRSCDYFRDCIHALSAHDWLIGLVREVYIINNLTAI
jgi:hypothetical protein